MTDDYMPTTDEVRFSYAEDVSPGRTHLATPEFDRWLDAHDREVKAEAWDDCVDSVAFAIDGDYASVLPENPYRGA